MKYYALFLNPMRGRMEERHAVAVSDSEQRLQALLDDNRVERYSHKEGDGSHPSDRVWNKCYRQGSILEWYNAPEDCGQGYGIIELGSREDYCERAGREFDEFINRHRIY